MSALYRTSIAVVVICIALIAIVIARPAQAALPTPGQSQLLNTDLVQETQPPVIPTSLLPAPPTTTPIVGAAGLPIGAAPLTISQSIESNNAAPGQQVVVTVSISSLIGGSITAASQIQGPAIVTAASVADGTCHGASCNFNIAAGQNVTMLLHLQIGAGSPGNTVTIQSVVQDESNYAAASDQDHISIFLPAPAAPANSQPATAVLITATPAPPAPPAPLAPPAPPAQGAGPAAPPIPTMPAAPLVIPAQAAPPPTPEFQQKPPDPSEPNPLPEQQAQPEAPLTAPEPQPQDAPERGRKQRG